MACKKTPFPIYTWLQSKLTYPTSVDDDVALRAKVDEALTVYDEYVKNKNDAPTGEAAQPEAGKPAEETKS